MTTFETLQEQVLALTPGQRGILFKAIAESFETGSEELDRAMLEEAESRLDAMESGEMGTIDADELHARLRERLVQGRS